MTAAENKPNMMALATVSFIFMGVLNEQIIYGKMHYDLVADGDD